jgi:hypothetical protein
VYAYNQALKVYAEGKIVTVFTVQTHAEAAQSLSELRDMQRQGILYVSTQDSHSAIYGVSGNTVFRAFHDAGHLEYSRTFDHCDEVMLGLRQWADIKDHIPEADRQACSALYHADSVGMSHFADLTGGEFPADQTEFVLYVASRVATGTIHIRDAVGEYVNKDRAVCASEQATAA